MARLQLKQVNKQYPNGYHAIHDVNLDVTSGEFVVIVGPSGCGKSTLLRMVAGLESISSGAMLLADERVNDKTPSERDIAMVFQNYALYPHMSVFDNMAYGLKIRKLSKDDIKKRVEDTAQILGLTDLLKRKPKQLSGGQRQRVAMGRAIVRQPKLFLFDEPLSNLDAKLRVQMRLEMQAIHKRLGITSLYVTHDQVEAMTLAERIVILNKGHIEQVGTPDEIYNQPASTFVAEFIGSPPMNLLPVSRIANGWQLTDATLPIVYGNADNNDKPIALNSANTQAFEMNNANALLRHADRFGIEPMPQTVWLGIRPERITLMPGTDNRATADSTHADSNTVSLSGVIQVVEQLGAEVLVYLAVANKTVIARCASDAFARHQLSINAPCQLSFQTDDVYWFDNKTGKAIAGI